MPFAGDEHLIGIVGRFPFWIDGNLKQQLNRVRLLCVRNASCAKWAASTYYQAPLGWLPELTQSY